jgi:hypothetical protein
MNGLDASSPQKFNFYLGGIVLSEGHVVDAYCCICGDLLKFLNNTKGIYYVYSKYST